MRIALAQLNPVVGDFDGNLAKIEKTLASLRAERPDLVVFPELFLTGYPPRDLLERAWFVEKAAVALGRLADISRAHPATGILAGTILKSGHGAGKGLSNAAVLVRNGDLVAARPKTLLPSYDVFDETRYFDPAERVDVVGFGGEALGISICEDAWADEALWPRKVYDSDPIEDLARLEATVLINIASSPFSVGKDEVRHGIFTGHAKRHGLPFVVVNQVGGNDELIFDGRSMVVGADGRLIAYLPAFEECVQLVDLARPGSEIPFAPDDPVASVHDALVLGLRDYVRKCGFEKVVLGLSGGVDSAVGCAIAVAALGPTNVVGVTMPSPYSSAGSVEDSKALAANLGVKLETVPIEGVYSSYLTTLRPLFKETALGTAEENVQARVRGNILMALSNKFGYLVLSTGNKSELAVGYCTLYGDMSGGLSVISDVPKTMVYALARHVNRAKEIIPRATIEKAPSAELKPGQTDQDTLPPYEVLDPILDLYVEEGRSPKEIVRAGFDRATVDWVVRAVNGSEYKRRQAAPGLKVTSKAFGMGRRMPIAARYGS
jgi:NAD+ synthase (glutamine-hydrolysing)